MAMKMRRRNCQIVKNHLNSTMFGCGGIKEKKSSSYDFSLVARWVVVPSPRKEYEVSNI
jgi:hypothetical protein